MQYLRILRKFLRITHYTVGKSCSQSNQHITFADTEVGSLRTVHANHTCVTRIMPVEYSLTHKRITDRGIQLPRKFSDFLISAGNDRAATYIDERFLRIPKKGKSLLQILLRILGRLVDGFRFFLLKFIAVGGHVFCDIYQYRSGSSASRYREGFSKRIGQNTDILDDIVMLRDRHSDTCNIYLLEGILPQGRKHHITGDRHHGNRIHISSGNPRHKIRGSGPACRKAYPYLTGCPGVSVRRMGCSLLM